MFPVFCFWANSDLLLAIFDNNAPETSEQPPALPRGTSDLPGLGPDAFPERVSAQAKNEKCEESSRC